eukprot:scaffold1802_cov162-Chaetoceros_neogracile.AAC.4
MERPTVALTISGKVAWGKMAQVTNHLELVGYVNAVLLIHRKLSQSRIAAQPDAFSAQKALAARLQSPANQLLGSMTRMH